MIRTYDKGIVELEDGSVLNRVEVYCDSGDTKPTSGIVNGSTLTEVDTGKTYLFDESNSSWTEVSTGGGGVSGQVYEFSSAVQNAIYSTVESAVIACMTSGNTSASSNSLQSVVTSADFATAESAFAQAESGLIPVFVMLGANYCCPTTIAKGSNDTVAISLLIPNYGVNGTYVKLTLTLDINANESYASFNSINVVAEPFYTESNGGNDNPSIS